jgi:hypothetical protein
LPDISKINALDIGSVSKVDGLAKASILDINGVAVSVAPPLDTYTGAEAAYSVRLLRTAYTGDIMRVRRDSDNVEADIGFDSNNEFSLTSPVSNPSAGGPFTDFADFIGHGGTPANGFCRWWYDQSGNAVDAGQATSTTQPQIYSSASGIIETGATGFEKPALDFDAGAGDRLSATVSISNTQSSSNFVVVQGDNTALGAYRIVDHATGSVFRNMSFFNSQFNIFDGTNGLNAGTAVDNTQYLMEGYYKTNDAEIYVDNSSVGTATTWNQTTVSNLQFGRSSNGLDGTIQEVIIWATDQRVSNRSGIATNINGYFKIF